MKTVCSALGAAVTALTLAASPLQAETDETIVTILTAPEAQTQLMAMVLTLNAAQQGASPHVLLCGPAGDLALRDAPASATTGQPPKDVSPQALMTKIMGLPGAKVEVCAIYLPGRGDGPEVLIDGVGVAKPGEMAAAIRSADTRMSF
ncbi:MAG: hypothetical protein OIF47_13205 [Marinibacterium sp.]|nr:hypothetical protein [Marinibacterium sp.]